MNNKQLTKELTMNKLTKIGASALCGSLATISAADAGELAVTGSAIMTWSSIESSNTGNPLGINSAFSLDGSSELENGWTAGLGVAIDDKNTYSNANVTLGVPGIGDFRISQGVSGSGIDRMDDKTPIVWEEAYATGLSTGIDTVAGVSGGAGIEFTPSMTPDGLTARVSWSPNACGSGSTDKASSGVCAGVTDTGFDVTLSASSDLLGVEGLSIYGGISRIDQHQNGSATNDDKDEETVGISYAMGGFTVGYQMSSEDLGRATGATKYENDGYGITFSVNDNLSVGYNHYESEQSNSTNVTAEASSVQLSYTMGGATFVIAEATSDNNNYSTAAGNDNDATTVSVALAF